MLLKSKEMLTWAIKSHVSILLINEDISVVSTKSAKNMMHLMKNTLHAQFKHRTLLSLLIFHTPF